MSMLTLISVLPRREDFSSGSRMRNLTKQIMADFSTHECASREQYAINFDSKTPSSTNGCCCFKRFNACALAASIVTNTHSLADVCTKQKLIILINILKI